MERETGLLDKRDEKLFVKCDPRPRVVSPCEIY